MRRAVAVEIVEDRTSRSRCDEGFLRLARLLVRSRYVGGGASDAYPCDVVSRPDPDAVAAVLYRRRPDGRVSVILKEGVRPPVYLRRLKPLVRPETREDPMLVELAAGVLESADAGAGGLARRAAIEVREEVGVALPPEAFAPLGEGLFASPGISDEKVYFCVAEAGAGTAAPPAGDGSAMEEGTRAVELDLGEAIRMCRDGRIPDMKTEVALLRLADRVGYIPFLDQYAKGPSA